MASTKEVELKTGPQRSDSHSEQARSKRANKGGGFGTDRTLVKGRENYKVFCAGLSLLDLARTFCLLMLLYAIVTGIFTGLMLWLQDTQLTSLNNDYAFWICFGFGLTYWVTVAVMVATGSRVQFDAALDEEELKKN